MCYFLKQIVFGILVGFFPLNVWLATQAGGSRSGHGRETGKVEPKECGHFGTMCSISSFC